jgi:hypothetical protein
MIRRPIYLICIVIAAVVSGNAIMRPALATDPTESSTTALKTHLTANDVFHPTRTLMFQDDFSSPAPLSPWSLSEDDRYDLPGATPGRIDVVAAPNLPGVKAARFFVNRAPNSFRAEISLPSEKGWNERWYAERIFLPEDWVLDPSKARSIVMQWHGIPGNFRATYPNLALAVENNHWVIARSFGDPKTKPTRDYATIGEIKPGTWVSWVVHAKWSPNKDGLIQIWKDGQLVFDRKGSNIYGTLGIEYTPYLKTGIYHPFWHVSGDASRRDDQSRVAFDAETAAKTPVKNKTVYVADFKMGNEHATYNDVAPAIVPQKK